MRDDTVKPGKVYYYKIRTRKKYKGKYYYSNYSNRVRIPAVNFTGSYTAEGIVNTENPDELILKLKSNQYNGKLTFSSRVIYDASDWEGESFAITEYSKDNKTWKAFKAGQVSVLAGETIYIKLSGKDISSLKELTFDEGAVSYDGCGIGYSVFTFDINAKKARVYHHFD